MPTYTYKSGLNDGVTNFNFEKQISAGAGLVLDETIPGGSSDLQIATFAFVVAKLQAIKIWADRAMTLKTNNSGAPQETINLLASRPLQWIKDDAYFAVPFAGNVTTLYVTLAAGADSILYVRGIVDPT